VNTVSALRDIGGRPVRSLAEKGGKRCHLRLVEKERKDRGLCTTHRGGRRLSLPPIGGKRRSTEKKSGTHQHEDLLGT